MDEAKRCEIGNVCLDAMPSRSLRVIAPIPSLDHEQRLLNLGQKATAEELKKIKQLLLNVQPDPPMYVII